MSKNDLILLKLSLCKATVLYIILKLDKPLLQFGSEPIYLEEAVAKGMKSDATETPALSRLETEAS